MLASSIKSVIEAQLQEFDGKGKVSRWKSAFLALEDDFVTILSGVRRCGKSTMLRQWCAATSQKTMILNFDDFRMMTFQPEDFRVLDYVLRELSPEVLVFDEIQTIPGWELYIRQKLDGHYRCIVTGSNASMLSRELGTKLTGRHLNCELFPFSYSEYLAYLGISRGAESFREYLEHGGFPAYLKSGNVEILKMLLEDILYRDISIRYGIQDVSLLRSLSLFLISVASNLVNPTKLTQVFHIRSATTMLEYFHYLEQSYLIQRVPKYATSERAMQLAPKKIYVIDNALITANRINNKPDRGFLLENTVYQYLRNHYSEIFYYSDSYGECDFLVGNRDGEYHAIQVCWEIGPECQKREYSGLIRCMKSFGLREGTIITFDQRDFAVEEALEIHTIPAWEYCVDA